MINVVCLEEVETIEHIFWSCNKTSKLWEDYLFITGFLKKLK